MDTDDSQSGKLPDDDPHASGRELLRLQQQWFEARERWLDSGGDYKEEHELWTRTIDFLSALSRSIVIGQLILDFTSSTIKSVLEGRLPLAFQVSGEQGPGPGRHHPAEVRQAVLAAVRYVRKAEAGLLDEGEPRARRTVARIYRVTRKAVEDWLDQFPEEMDWPPPHSDARLVKVESDFERGLLELSARHYRTWYRKAGSKIGGAPASKRGRRQRLQRNPRKHKGT
jgi:hypothetical protein